MSEIFLLYIWLKLDTLLGLAAAYLIAAAIAICVWCLVSHIESFERPGFQHPTVRKLAFSWLFTLVFVAFVPDAKQTAVMVGAHYALRAAASPEGEKVMTLLRRKANEYLDAELGKQK